MKKDPLVYLHQILDCINLVQKNLKDVSERKFYRSDVLKGFAERELEIIGEASTRIPKEFKAKYSQVPWHEIVATRNFLIHEYEDVEDPIVWDTISNGFPTFKKQIEEILKKESK